ncbi:GNAT family N-acetyltransferase [Kitasatospora cheerisanensis]|uniref:Putative acetyltransferase n=1 Tax=Kitasatospora cheerisanensis KCTC 2395 TaxID=1348663 RepID=A0A066YQA2_9ACTN|nr:GNAT family N-acetyltransferase [Kitasatospora cheerisanensis]KDN82159.1 putative acetyltransferase [Kitasatospora cheerisanensis KCTC 2395]
MRALAEVRDDPLTDDGLLLRRPRPADAPLVLRGTHDPLVREFLQAVIPHQDEAAAERWLTEIPPLLWRTGRAAYFAVEQLAPPEQPPAGDPADGAAQDIPAPAGQAVGWAELVNLDPVQESAEVAVWLLPEHRRLRTAKSAMRLVCRFGFERLGLRRIDAFAAADNMPSQLTGAAIGFRRAGYRPALFRSSRTQRLHDAVYATLVPEDLC